MMTDRLIEIAAWAIAKSDGIMGRRERDGRRIDHTFYLEDAAAVLTALREVGAIREWRPIDLAPLDGSAFLAYGIHDTDDPPGAQRGVKAGDHWWAILLWDIWRTPNQFVFAKDGSLPWSEPTRFQPLPSPPEER